MLTDKNKYFYISVWDIKQDRFSSLLPYRFEKKNVANIICYFFNVIFRKHFKHTVYEIKEIERKYF